MAIFKNLYARHYDLMYGKKDYAAEVDFYHALIRKYAPRTARRVVSFGAGTLNHEMRLARRGFVIDGVELSSEMVRLARKKIAAEKLKNIRVMHGDMRSFKSAPRYDIALSMFNAVSYCDGLKELKKVMLSASHTLKPGGIFIFDFWNAEAVAKSPPQNRWAKFTARGTELYRLTNPVLMPGTDCFDLSIELIAFEQKRLVGRELEHHRVCAWRMPDIKKMLAESGLRLVTAGRFMDAAKSVSAASWSAFAVAKKGKA